MDFDTAELEELAESIKVHGVIQPVIVEEDPSGGWTLVAGERRTRAARLAGLTEIPALVRSYDEAERMEVALIENIQRANLNPIEEALAYRQLMDSSGLSQEEAAQRLGKSRSALANTLRLLKLPEPVQAALRDGSVSAGHARAILALNSPEDQAALFEAIKRDNLSVREAELWTGKGAEAAHQTESGKPQSAKPPAKKKELPRDADLAAIEQKFIEVFGTKVSIDGNFDGGQIRIQYFSREDLDRIYEIVAADFILN
jgi:ParB family chromosome partitioning protein